MKKYFLITLLTLGGCLGSISSRAQIDLGVTGVANPVSGCNMPCWQKVIVTVYNYGSTMWVTPFSVSCSMNGGPSVVETATPAIFNTGATFTYTFVDSFNICPHGVYNFLISVQIAGDVNMANNTFNYAITHDTTVVPGNLTPMSDSVCLTANSGTLNLSNYIGYINHWEYSTDGGINWINIANTSDSYNYINLDSTSLFQVYIDGGYCPDNTSSQAIVTIVPPPIGGTAVGTATVCSTGNTGQISLSGQTGNIVSWQTSLTGGAPWTPLGNNNNPYTYNNISNTTYYQAVVSNGGYCPDVTSSIVLITVAPPTIPGSVSSNAVICQFIDSGSVSLIGNTGNVLFWLMSNDGINWTQFTGGTTVNYNGLADTTWYTAVVQNGICPQDTATPAIITVVPAPPIYAGADTTISLGDTVCFNATGGVLYAWTPGTLLNNPGIPNPCMVATSVGNFPFTLVGQDGFGCTNIDYLTVTVLDTVTIFPPVICNFITPNNDGLNDVWNIINIKFYPDNEVFVYNNHGQEVYHKVGYLNDWKGDYNGEQLPDGSYYYLVKFNTLSRTLKGVVSITDTP